MPVWLNPVTIRIRTRPHIESTSRQPPTDHCPLINRETTSCNLHSKEERLRVSSRLEFHSENMAGRIPPMLQFAGSAAAILIGGFLTASVVVESLRINSEKQKRKTAPPCSICKGKGFYSCKLCEGNSTIEWSPLYDPIVINLCVCPTCNGNRVQRCLNCIGRGYAI